MKTIQRFLLSCFIAVGLPVFAPMGILYPQAAVVDNLWMTDGTVYATAFRGNTIYIGGDFTYVGPLTGNFAVLDSSSGTRDASFPRVTGTVRAIASDGSGGWFIGGDFTAVGGVVRNNIAHIKSNKTVDASWHPSPDNRVCALAVSPTGAGGSTVYAGGYFNNIDDSARSFIAALDASTGAVTTWNPNANGNVYALAVSGSTVYVGGAFNGSNSIGDSARTYIAAIDTSTGKATAWDPEADYEVYALAVSGSTVYAGGDFEYIGGVERDYIAAIDSTGAATTWNPSAYGDVYALAVSGSTVYAGGEFEYIGGDDRYHIAALDSTSPGITTGWNPYADGDVYALAVSGSTVYVGGSFTWIGGKDRNHIAALDTSTGVATGWDPNAGSNILALAVSGSTVCVGGEFSSINGAKRLYVAALDASTGTATSWNPISFYIVKALAVSGSTVYAGGQFTNIGGQSRNYIAALDTSTGKATTWNPDANNQVLALAVSGSTVYVGGVFNGSNSIGGSARNYIAAIDSVSPGTATAWNPNANGYVHALALSGSTVYVGGDFTNIGGQPRNYIVALDTSTGVATSWNPNANGTSVAALAVSDSTVYAGGDFTTIGVDSTRNHIAAIDSVSPGTATSWNPNASHMVQALAASGSMVYAAGDFTTVGGQPRNGIAAIDFDGNVTTWNPNASGSVYALALDTVNARVYAGGSFTIILNDTRSYFAGLTNPDDAALPVQLVSLNATVSGSRVQLAWNTATEVSSYGFEIERKVVAQTGISACLISEASWGKIGFVQGAGTSSRQRSYTFTDADLPPGRYAYRIKQIDRDGTFRYTEAVELSVGDVPMVFSLDQNYPNPFNPMTTIRFGLPRSSKVRIVIYNVLGQAIKTLLEEELPLGYHKIEFDGSQFASGVYFYRLTAADPKSGSGREFVKVRKLVLVK